MTKSNRSSTAYINQWSTTGQTEREREGQRSRSRDSHRHRDCERSQDRRGESSLERRHYNLYSSVTSHSQSQGPAQSQARPPFPSSPSSKPTSLIGIEVIPGSPSQIDPFGSQVTSPEPVRIRSRPPSTVLSNGSFTPLTSNGGAASVVVTPKIILASPSTSTIHYLFPSSDTRSGGLLVSATTSTSTASAEVDRPASVHRSKSTASTKGRGDRNSLVQISEQKDRNKSPGHRTGFPTAQKRKKSSSVDLFPHATTVSALASAKRLPGTNTSGVRKSDISNPILGLPQDDMVGLRRQPGMIDLSARGKGVNTIPRTGEETDKSVRKRESLILREIENRRERRGWEIGSRPHHVIDSTDPPSPRSRTTATHNGTQIRGPLPYPYVPASTSTFTTAAQRRRSQSLSSPRPAPLPPLPVKDQISPLLPAPDLGDPLTLSVVIDSSPSYSHLDYSAAGSSTSSSQRKSKGWSKKTAPIFPVSVAMSRGDTRRGLGNYDAGKLKAREDAEKRLNGASEQKVGRFASIRRTVSLRRKGEPDDERKSRPRSQSLTARSARTLGLAAPPLPLPSMSGTNPSEKERHSFFGDLSIDLGDRYTAFSPSKPTPSEWLSPLSTDTSVFPHSTPTSEYDTFPSATSAIEDDKEANVIRLLGRPLHPALNASEVSILAPSTIGLGFSPIGTPVSLPESLAAEVIDLTQRGRKLSSPVPQVKPISLHSSPPVSPVILLPAPKSVDSKGSSEKHVPRRSLLLAQNTFYLPPLHQKPAVGQKSTLRSSKSLGQGFMKRAYTSANLKSDAAASRDNGTMSAGRSLLKSASIRSRRPSAAEDQRSEDTARQGLESSGRISATPSMRFRRPVTTFSLCSPPDAIDPLPYNSPDPAISEAGYTARSESRTLRSNKSSPFLSASASLRVILGREGFVARSFSQAFETRDQREKERHAGAEREKAKERTTSYNSGENAARDLKAKISSPLEANRSTFRTHNEDTRASFRRDNRTWRESILKDAVSLSFREGLNTLAEGPSGSTPVAQVVPRSQQGQRMVSSGSKSRLAIPELLLSAPEIQDPADEVDGGPRESKVFAGIGEAMLRSTIVGESIKSGLSLRAVMEDLELPSRGLDQVGKEESMASASVYSNNASTLFESKKPPSTRFLGKGLPSSLSTMTNTTVAEGVRGTLSSSSKLPALSSDNGQKGKGTSRIISPPMPFVKPSTEGSTRPLSLSLRSIRPSYNPYPNQLAEVEEERLRSPSPSSESRPHISPSRSKLLNFRSLSGKPGKAGDGNPSAIAIEGGSAASTTLKREPSSFSLSLRSSLRSYSYSRRGGNSPQPPAQSSKERNQPISSTDYTASSAKAILDQLVARDEAEALAAAAAAFKAGQAAPSSGEEDKVKKVLAWRTEVDENERLAKLEERMRGFVRGEKERIRDIAIGMRSSVERTCADGEQI